jgi:Zn-dependent protease with chaperone function
MVEYAGQAVAHAAVAAVVVEALLRVWRITEPDARISFRLIPILLPIVVLPALLVVAPGRSSELFRERWALFSSARWGRAGVLGLGAAVALGIGLFLVDLVRYARAAIGSRRPGGGRSVASGEREASAQIDATDDERVMDALGRDVDEAAHRLGVETPPLVVLDSGEPVLHVTGVRRPTLVVSRGTLERLTPEERRAALVHEVAHVARRDPAFGWLLMVCRTLGIFNPIVQLVARTVVRDLEWRADDLAVAITGDAGALASGLGKLFSATEGDRGEASGILARGRAAAIELRRQRLLHRPRPASLAFHGVRVAMTAASLTLLLFFVV